MYIATYKPCMQIKVIPNTWIFYRFYVCARIEFLFVFWVNWAFRIMGKFRNKFVDLNLNRVFFGDFLCYGYKFQWKFQRFVCLGDLLSIKMNLECKIFFLVRSFGWSIVISCEGYQWMFFCSYRICRHIFPSNHLNRWFIWIVFVYLFDIMDELGGNFICESINI